MQSVIQYLASKTDDDIKYLIQYLGSIKIDVGEEDKSESIIEYVDKYLDTKTYDEEEDESPRLTISPLKNNAYKYYSSTDHTKQMTHSTVSVPNSRYSPSFVNNDRKANKSSVFIKENISECEEKKREEEQVMINYCTVEWRWIKHYSSSHQILLVGEGDFSFSASLAEAFGWAANMVATSLDSQDFLLKNYQNALSNLQKLSIMRCEVMHEIDATEMADHEFLGRVKFDRIIFNFPFAGFFKNLPRISQLRRHRKLVSRFMKNAKRMLSENGEIHISHKTNGFHSEWNLESIASSRGLRLIEAVDFDQAEYPGYNTKYGFGGDNNFNCNPSKTYKFGLDQCIDLWPFDDPNYIFLR